MNDTPPLLVNQRSGRVLVARPGDDGEWAAREIASEGRWPSWSADGRWTVRSTLLPAGETARSAIVAEALDGVGRARVYASPPGQATFIAPNVPHYALWSPDGSAVSYVAATDQGLSLALTRLDGTVSNQRIATGMPLFHSWSTDSSRIAVHEGSRLSTWDWATLELKEVHEGAVGFRTPQFTTEGNLLYAAQPPAGGIALFSQDPAGRATELARFDGGLAFLPAGGAAFVAATHQTDGSAFDSLWRVALDGSGREPVARGPFAAFWPSPAGDLVVIAAPAQTGDGRVALQARQLSGEQAGATEAFIPSDDFRVAMAFFDQYALSHCPWSASGEFVVCGRAGTDGVSASFGDPEGDYVMTWRAERGQPLERVMPGVFASFAAKARPPEEPQ